MRWFDLAAGARPPRLSPSYPVELDASHPLAQGIAYAQAFAASPNGEPLYARSAVVPAWNSAQIGVSKAGLGLVGRGRATTTLHYTANGNWSGNTYAPGPIGFNLADVSSAGQLANLPPGVRALVWLGYNGPADSTFQGMVAPFLGDARVWGFYLFDEPDISNSWGTYVDPANLKAQSDWIHANFPGAKTFFVLPNQGTDASYNYSSGGNAYTPTNTGIDYVGIDPYPVQTGGFDLTQIDRALAAIQQIGWTLPQIVPTYQAFGGGSYAPWAHWVMPTAAQLTQILQYWAARVPNPVFDYAYSYGAQNGDQALSQYPALESVFQAWFSASGSWGATSASNAFQPGNSGTALLYVSAGHNAGDGNARTLLFVGDPAGNNFSVGIGVDGNIFAGWSGSQATVSAAGLYSAGDIFTIGVSWDASGTRLWVKGKQAASNSSAPSVADVTSGEFCIGGEPANSAFWLRSRGDAVHSVLFWDRALSAGEIAAFDADPYGPFQPATAQTVFAALLAAVVSGSGSGGGSSPPTLHSIFADFAIPAAFALALRADPSIPAEWRGAATHAMFGDQAAPLAFGANAIRDQAEPIEFGGAAATILDSGSPLEFRRGAATDNIAAFFALLNEQADGAVPTDAIGVGRADSGLPVDATAKRLADAAAADEFGAAKLAEFSHSAAAAAMTARDAEAPLEFSGGARFDVDANLPLDFLGGAQADGRAGAANSASLTADAGVNLSWAMPVLVDAQDAVSWRSGVLQDARSPAEWFAWLSVDLPTQEDFAAALRIDAQTLAASLATARLDSTDPIAWIGVAAADAVAAEASGIAQIADTAAPAAWLQAAAFDGSGQAAWSAPIAAATLAPLEWGGGLYTTYAIDGSAPLEFGSLVTVDAGGVPHEFIGSASVAENRIQSKLYYGLGKAASKLGNICAWYRPVGVDSPLNHPIGDIQCAFQVPGSRYVQPSNYGKPQWWGLLDASRCKVGDYLIDGQLGTFFVASLEPIHMPLLISCNRTVSVLRPAAQVGVGALGYGGDYRPAETPIMTGWPAAMTTRSRGERGSTDLPGDVRAAWMELLLPAVPGVEIEFADVITDELGGRWKVGTAESSSLGWRLQVVQAQT